MSSMNQHNDCSEAGNTQMPKKMEKKNQDLR
jgi:hypothetical protein